MVEIFKTADSPDELSKEYDCPNIQKLGCKWFVYYYQSGDYEGSGFAVWKKGRKFFYSDLGHCSCYGPTEKLESIDYTFKEITKIASNYESYGSKSVIQHIVENLNGGNDGGKA
jgi:hypothetical protein